MSRGREERTPAQLAVLAQAHEKAKIVIAERAKLNALAKKDDSEPVSVKSFTTPSLFSITLRGCASRPKLRLGSRIST